MPGDVFRFDQERYGAGGQRIMKQVGDPANGGFREHYIRDAQGNIMAVYKYTNSGTASTKVVERRVYGSSRLGSYALAQEVMGTWLSTYPFTQLLSNPSTHAGSAAAATLRLAGS